MSNFQKITKITFTIFIISFYVLFMILNSFNDQMTDDAYITFRHVRNLIDGNGFVYNPGEAVLGTTSPGYALLLTPATMIFGADTIPQISIIVNLLAILAILFCFGLIAYKFFNRNYFITLLAPIIVFGSPTLLHIMVTGMEVPVFFLLITISLILLIYRKWLPACIAAGLTIWLRPEGAFLIGLMGITVLVMTLRKTFNRQSFFVYSAALGIPGLAYVMMLFTFYGTILPQSIIAKTSGLYAYERFSQSGPVLLHIASPLILFLNTFYESGNSDFSVLLLFFVLTPLSVVLIVVGSIELIKLDRVLWLVPVYLLIAIVFYSSRSTRLFVWYHGNYHLIILILFSIGFGKILYSIAHAISDKVKVEHIAVVTVLFISLPFILPFPYQKYLEQRTLPYKGGDRVALYHDLLQEIGDDIPQDAVVALPEIGYIGFYLPENKIIDLAGLVSPEIVDYFPVSLEERDNDPTNSAIPRDAIYDLQPDLIITYAWFGVYGLYRAEWFDELYEITYSVPGDEDGEFTIDVIVRRDRLDDIVISPGSEND